MIPEFRLQDDNVDESEAAEEEAVEDIEVGVRSGVVRPSHRTLVLPLASCFLAFISATAFLYSFQEVTLVLSFTIKLGYESLPCCLDLGRLFLFHSGHTL